MAIPTRFLQKVALATELGGQEVEALAQFCQGLTPVSRGAELIVEGHSIVRGFVFEAGWGCRYRLLQDGRRQILNFVVPGDCIGASAGVYDVAGDTLITLTPAVVQSFDTAKMESVRRRLPRLDLAFAWSVRRDYSMLQERIVDLGRRTARERVVHLLLELLDRLATVGLSDGASLDLPLTQETLGDALGLSIVHVNRMLRALNNEGLIRYRPGHVVVTDPARLRAIAGFDRRYLRQNGFLLRQEGNDLATSSRAAGNGRPKLISWPSGRAMWK